MTKNNPPANVLYEGVHCRLAVERPAPATVVMGAAGDERARDEWLAGRLDPL